MPTEARTQQFLAHLQAAYSREQTYHPAHHLDPIHCPPSRNFSAERRTQVTTLFQAPESTNETPKAFFSEWAAFICMASPLDKRGFTTEMAPEPLEQGAFEPRRRGIDLVISERLAGQPANPVLGINVKMHPLAPYRRTERQRFDPKLCAPSMTLSLGDWQISTREEQQTRIRGWIANCAVPNIRGTGKLPHFYDLRKFIFERMRHTLDSYAGKLHYFLEGEYQLNEHEARLVPTDPQDFESFYTKLLRAQKLFAALTER